MEIEKTDLFRLCKSKDLAAYKSLIAILFRKSIIRNAHFYVFSKNISPLLPGNATFFPGH